MCKFVSTFSYHYVKWNVLIASIHAFPSVTRSCFTSNSQWCFDRSGPFNIDKKIIYILDSKPFWEPMIDIRTATDVEGWNTSSGLLESRLIKLLIWRYWNSITGDQPSFSFFESTPCGVPIWWNGLKCLFLSQAETFEQRTAVEILDSIKGKIWWLLWD